MTRRPGDLQRDFLLQVVLVGVLLPIATYFLLRYDQAHASQDLAWGLLLLAASCAAGWRLWKKP